MIALERVKARDWFQVEKVGDDVSLISEPFIKPFYRCNVWHVKGRDADMLVDSGMGVVDLRPQVTRLSGKRCRRLSTVLKRISAVRKASLSKVVRPRCPIL